MRRTVLLVVAVVVAPLTEAIAQERLPTVEPGFEFAAHGVYWTLGGIHSGGPAFELGLGQRFRSGVALELRGGYRSWRRSRGGKELLLPLQLGLRYELPSHRRLAVAPFASIGPALGSYRGDAGIGVGFEVGVRLYAQLGSGLRLALATAFGSWTGGVGTTSPCAYIGAGVSVHP